MTPRPSRKLRRRVAERADNRCEYCLVRQQLSASVHQIDHVIADKHGGPTTFENLALSCTPWNEQT
ncbi:MAG: HNH endonuclease [Planctomycetes bacterium]|nr:HNH endonuclease [Planctomycetota bacterium]